MTSPIYCPRCDSTAFFKDRNGIYWDNYGGDTEVDIDPQGRWFTLTIQTSDNEINDSDPWACANGHVAADFIQDLLDDERPPEIWPPPTPQRPWAYDRWLELIEEITEYSGNDAFATAAETILANPPPRPTDPEGPTFAPGQPRVTIRPIEPPSPPQPRSIHRQWPTS